MRLIYFWNKKWRQCAIYFIDYWLLIFRKFLKIFWIFSVLNNFFFMLAQLLQMVNVLNIFGFQISDVYLIHLIQILIWIFFKKILQKFRLLNVAIRQYLFCYSHNLIVPFSSFIVVWHLDKHSFLGLAWFISLVNFCL